MEDRHTSRPRSAVLRFCLTTLIWVGCALVLVCVLSFDPADPPSTSVWPPSAVPSNLCGAAGAWLAHQCFYYLGIGAYPLVVLLAIGTLAWSYGVRLRDAWIRCIGLGLAVAAASTAATLYLAPSAAHLITGPGGVLGLALAQFVTTALGSTGALLLIVAGALIGLLLAADEIVLALLRGAGWLSRKSAPALARGGSALAGVGAAASKAVADRAVKLAGGAPSGTRPPSSSDGSRARSRAAAPAADLDDDEPDPESPAAAPPDVIPPAGRNGQPKSGRAVPPAERIGLARLTDDDEPSTSTDAAALPGETAGRSLTITRIKPEAPASPTDRPRFETGNLFATPPPDDHYVLPGWELLEEPTPLDKESLEILCREKAYVLEQTLNEFRLEVKVVAIETGPVITVFELKLAPGIKVSQIASLTNDMARALKAPAVRVVAPLPGKNTIGIEVPNIDKEKVRLKDLLELSRSHEGLAIPLYLGKDAAGQPLVSDLTRMPHLLVAGTTGSGKSVCIASIIMSVLLTRRPSEVNLILVDPKVVELAMFKDVPHLMCPIVTEMTKAEGILDWAATKMDERYALLAEAGVKDIRSYNKLGVDGLRERFQPTDEEEFARIPKRLPYIVIVIDELADLMMTSAKEVEFYLCRLAQKSRAVGIHLIVSTQRPQANVVTGLVKSNLPCRIAFRVASRLDSRIVLDQNGGEILMGQGDMLFLPPGSSKLVRAQGTFIADDELRRTVKHCKTQSDPHFHPELLRMPGAGGPAGEGGERDELFDQAVDIILETGRGSVSLLQRRLTIGYGRASRLIDQMYTAGIVGEYKGSQAREVIVSREEWQAIRNQRDREEADEQARAG